MSEHVDAKAAARHRQIDGATAILARIIVTRRPWREHGCDLMRKTIACLGAPLLCSLLYSMGAASASADEKPVTAQALPEDLDALVAGIDGVSARVERPTTTAATTESAHCEPHRRGIYT